LVNQFVTAQMKVPLKLFKLLIADDSRIYRRLLEDTLSEQRYSTFFAKSGREAMDLFLEHQPDLVITDWMMPDLTGVELCKRMRDALNHSYAYIIILTSLTDKRGISAGLSAGADDYIAKPFEPEELRARVGVGCRVIEFHRQLEAKTHLLEQLALTDELTGLPNRRAIEAWAVKQIAGAARHGFQLCAVMVDLDRFKGLNDSFGHEAGDTVLKKFAQLLKDNCRSSDLCGRIGGEEFLIVLTHSDINGATIAVEHIRESLAEKIFTFGTNDIVVTASFGIATLERGSEDFGRLVSRADDALYSAKQLGRNRLAIATTAHLASHHKNSK
jgi:two-component system, cell cycle response regulator